MSDKIKQKAVEIISENFGESTAKLYEDYYSGKTDKEIKTSVKELLIELVGPKNAAKQVKGLK